MNNYCTSSIIFFILLLWFRWSLILFLILTFSQLLSPLFRKILHNIHHTHTTHTLCLIVMENFAKFEPGMRKWSLLSVPLKFSMFVFIEVFCHHYFLLIRCLYYKVWFGLIVKKYMEMCLRKMNRWENSRENYIYFTYPSVGTEFVSVQRKKISLIFLLHFLSKHQISLWYI